MKIIANHSCVVVFCYLLFFCSLRIERRKTKEKLLPANGQWPTRRMRVFVQLQLGIPATRFRLCFDAIFIHCNSVISGNCVAAHQHLFLHFSTFHMQISRTTISIFIIYFYCQQAAHVGGKGCVRREGEGKAGRLKFLRSTSKVSTDL